MAEEAPVVRNKGMLVVAFVLAAVVVVIYNWQAARIRSEARGETIYLLRFRRNMRAGEQLDVKKDLVIDERSKQWEGRMGSVVVLARPAQAGTVDKYYLNQYVRKGDYLRYNHIYHETKDLPSSNLTTGMVGRSVPVDPRNVPGDRLRVGDHVSLFGIISLGKQTPESYRIIESVRVFAIGGQGLKETVSTRKGLQLADRGQRSYRSIVIELSPSESLILNNVLSHVRGGVGVELLPPNYKPTSKPGQVSKELRNLKAAPPRRYGSPIGPEAAGL